ncbi:MAG: hypothetical protein ACFNZS_12395, partial [Ottowia sp.]
MKPLRRAFFAALFAASLALVFAAFAASARAEGRQPGQGVKVYPIQSSIAEETFQTLLVVKALEQLGYDVQPIREIEYATGHLAIA